MNKWLIVPWCDLLLVISPLGEMTYNKCDHEEITDDVIYCNCVKRPEEFVAAAGRKRIDAITGFGKNVSG